MDNCRLDKILDRPWTYDDIHYWTNPEDNTCNAIIDYDGKNQDYVPAY